MNRNTTHIAVSALILAFCLSSATAFAQSPTVGIYLTVKFNKKCENQVLNFEGKKFCLAPQPVLMVEDLSYITDIKIDLGNKSYFTLVFTENGGQKLRNLAVAFPNTQIVLVVDKLIVGFLRDLDVLKSNSLKMTAGVGPGETVEYVHEKLRAVLPVRK